MYNAPPAPEEDRKQTTTTTTDTRFVPRDEQLTGKLVPLPPPPPPRPPIGTNTEEDKEQETDEICSPSHAPMRLAGCSLLSRTGEEEWGPVGVGGDRLARNKATVPQIQGEERRKGIDRPRTKKRLTLRE